MKNYSSWFLLGEEMGGTKALLLASQYPDTFTKVTATGKRGLEQKPPPSPTRNFCGEGKSCLHILYPLQDNTASGNSLTAHLLKPTQGTNNYSPAPFNNPFP